MEPLPSISPTGAVATTVFKKQLDAQKDQMSQLLGSVQQPVSLPPSHLGRNIDVRV